LSGAREHRPERLAGGGHALRAAPGSYLEMITVVEARLSHV
jgi:hypothetical protein